MRSAAEPCRQCTASKLDAAVTATGAVAMMLFAGTVNTAPDGGEIKLQSVIHVYSLVTHHIFVPCLFITIFVLHLNSCNFTFSNYMLLWRRGSTSSSHPVDPGSIPGASIVFEWHILSSREWFNLNDIIKLLHNLLWITVSLNSFWDHILDTFSFALFERSKWAFFTCRIRP